MPRSPAAFARIRSERKDQILAAAAGVFARKGLGAATLLGKD